MRPRFVDAKELVAYCTNSSDVRLIHGRTPEELDEWKERYVALLQAFDNANFAFYSMVAALSQQEGAMRDAAAGIQQAREALLSHIEEL